MHKIQRLELPTPTVLPGEPMPLPRNASVFPVTYKRLVLKADLGYLHFSVDCNSSRPALELGMLVKAEEKRANSGASPRYDEWRWLGDEEWGQQTLDQVRKALMRTGFNPEPALFALQNLNSKYLATSKLYVGILTAPNSLPSLLIYTLTHDKKLTVPHVRLVSYSWYINSDSPMYPWLSNLYVINYHGKADQATRQTLDALGIDPSLPDEVFELRTKLRKNVNRKP